MKYTFVMQLLEGYEDEYKKRHDDIWPELVELLKLYGISDYSISLEPNTLQLFGVFRAAQDFDSEGLKRQPVMLRWWESMSPLMMTQVDSHEPMVIPLTPLFYME